MNRMHDIRSMILNMAQRQPRIRVERRIWDEAFPHSMAERDPHSLATAIMTLAMVRGGNRPESTQAELEERFCRDAGLVHWRDPMTGDVLVEANARLDRPETAGRKDRHE